MGFGGWAFSLSEFGERCDLGQKKYHFLKLFIFLSFRLLIFIGYEVFLTGFSCYSPL